MRPDSGPATKTRAIRDLVRPREMRYGDATELLGHTAVGKGRFHRVCSPYAISMDHITCKPANPMVMTGKRAQGGPRILEIPAHCAALSDPASSAIGRALKPVMTWQ